MVPRIHLGHVLTYVMMNCPNCNRPLSLAGNCASCIKRGDKNPNWIPEIKLKDDTGRARARSWFAELCGGPCADCGNPGYDLHHKDGNPSNNVLENIELLCRRCHMTRDGRLSALRRQAKAASLANPHTPIEVCKRGHPLSGDNVRVTQRQRSCKTCTNMMRQLRRANGAKG